MGLGEAQNKYSWLVLERDQESGLRAREWRAQKSGWGDGLFLCGQWWGWWGFLTKEYWKESFRESEPDGQRQGLFLCTLWVQVTSSNGTRGGRGGEGSKRSSRWEYVCTQGRINAKMGLDQEAVPDAGPSRRVLDLRRGFPWPSSSLQHSLFAHCPHPIHSVSLLLPLHMHSQSAWASPHGNGIENKPFEPKSSKDFFFFLVQSFYF